MKKLILGALFLLGLVGTSHALTVAEILFRVRANISDQALTTYDIFAISDSMLLKYLNDGQREGNINGWLLQDQYSFYLASGTREYNLPSDFILTDRVLYNSIKLDQTSLSQLDAEQKGWVSATGTTPQKYYLYRTTSTVIGFFPKPYGVFTSSAVTVYFIKQPEELESLSDTPWNGWYNLTPYHTALVYYVTYRALRSLKDTETANLYYTEWQNEVEMMKKGVYNMPDFNPGFTGQRK